MTIDDIAAADIDEILELERQTPGAPHWQRSDYERLFEVSTTLGRRGVSARISGVIAGFAIAKILTLSGLDEDGSSKDEHTEAELEAIAVKTAAHRQGIGSQLLRAMLARLANDGIVDLHLEVRSSNLAAIALYSGFGFKQTGVRKGYYRDPDEDAILMHLRLP